MKTVAQLDAKDVRAMNKTLRNMEGNLLKQMRSEIRAIAKPVNDQIKINIPAEPPMRGMAKGNGRLVWFGSKKPKSTTISSAIKASGRSLTTPLVKITLNSAAVSMADMAGRVNRTRGVSRSYQIRLRDGSVVTRKHKVTTQGKQMIANLGGKASRYGWPALENRVDAVAREIDRVIEKYYRIANRG